MNILFCGDIVGRSGREAVLKYVPMLRKKLLLDVVIVNGENAAAGFGITDKIYHELLKAGVDIITNGNHTFDQKELVGQINQLPQLLRPINYPDDTPGRGFIVHTLPNGQKILVINAIARLYMEHSDNPFTVVDRFLKNYPLGQNGIKAIVLDFHGEATSEKQAMGYFLDGRASLVVGTHTHVPTADHQIMPQGTAYMTDAGMCGDYLSVVGMKRDVPVQRFIRKIPTDRLSAADGDGSLCGVFVKTDDQTGLALEIEPIRLGGKVLSQTPL